MEKKAPIAVFVKLYATLTKYVGVSIMEEPMQVDIPAGSTLSDLYAHLGIPDDEVKTAFVNSAMQPPEYELRDGDQVGIFPPVGGGKGNQRRKELAIKGKGKRGKGEPQWPLCGRSICALLQETGILGHK